MTELDKTIFIKNKKIVEHDKITAELKQQLVKSLEQFTQDVYSLQEVVEKEKTEKEELVEQIEEKDIQLKDIEQREINASEQIKTITVEVSRMKEKMEVQTVTMALEKSLREKYEVEKFKLEA